MKKSESVSGVWLPQPELGNVIKSARMQRGMSQTDLAKAIADATGKNWKSIQPAISAYEGTGKRIVDDGQYFPVIEEVLTISLKLQKGHGQPITSGMGLRATANRFDNPVTTSQMSRQLPIYNTELGGCGTLGISDEIAEHREGPSSLHSVRNAYGIRVAGTQMEPAYRPGDIIWINPHESGRAGDDVLLCDTGNRRLIRELVNETESDWIVRQHNPSKQSKLSKSAWPKCLKIKAKDNR